MAGNPWSKWTIVDVYSYPEGYKEVMSGNAYWLNEPITVVDRQGIYYFMADHWWRKYDPKHPQCYYCGKFVKAGNWWKGRWTGPCTDCYDSLYVW